MASDGGFVAASLVDVAVRAAVLAGAPRRTVAATAAAVATAVMVAMRLGAGAGGGAAAAPTASQLRRRKRKTKVAREGAVSAQHAAARQPHELDAAEDVVHAGAREASIPVAQATAPDIALQRPPPPPAVAAQLPRNMSPAAAIDDPRIASRASSRTRSAGSMSTTELRRQLGITPPRSQPGSVGRVPAGQGSDYYDGPDPFI